MPTPIGHALGGIAAGAFIVRRTTADVPVGARRIPIVLLFALLGLLPDIDFLLGGHRGVTHTVGATLAVGVLVAAVDRRPAVWLAAAAAYGSHVLLDWLGTDTVAPIGVMAFWPFDTTFYLSPYHWFLPVCRQYWLTDCWFRVARAIWWELLVLGPPALAGLLLARRSPTTDTGPDG